jgi:hypothetical protein
MSETKFEFLKILVDKGLLAIILLGIAFYLNRTIEQYKAANVYHQKISEAKIQAYQEFSKALGKRQIQIQRIINLIAPNPYPIDKGLGDHVNMKALWDAMQEYQTSFMEHNAALDDTMLFVSSDLSKKIIEYMRQVAQFKETLESMVATKPEGWGKYAEWVNNMHTVSDDLLKSVASTQSALRVEIHRNPFS